MSVAIVAMVNHSAIIEVNDEPVINDCGNDLLENSTSTHKGSNGEFAWDSREQGILLSSFFVGYVLTQIPFGMLSKKYGAKYFLGIGMLVNSVFAFLVPVSAHWGWGWLIVIRFIQGLGEVSTMLLSIPNTSFSFSLSFSIFSFLYINHPKFQTQKSINILITHFSFSNFLRPKNISLRERSVTVELNFDVFLFVINIKSSVDACSINLRLICFLPSDMVLQ